MRSSRLPDNGWEEYGGYMQAKKSKLTNQYAESTDRLSSIFTGVSIYVNGYTNPPSHDLKSLIIKHGGLYQTYYNREKVTHIIASRLPTGKVNRLIDQKVVSANWIVESIKVKKLLPWQQFRLYHGRNFQPGQQILRVVPATAIPSSPNSERSLVADHYSLDGDEHIQRHVSSNTSCSSNSSSSVVPAEGLSAVKHRRTQQTRLDNGYLSPCKPSNGNSVTSTAMPTSSTAATEANLVTLKQLLQTGGVQSQNSIQPGCGWDKNEAGASDRLAQFYARSRLHHLSSWANELREFVRDVRDNPKKHVCDLGQSWRLSELNSVASCSNEQSVPSVLSLCAELSNSSKTSKLSLPKPHSVFLHIDMDCFFVAVGLRDKPELRDKPVAVTHAKGAVDVRRNPGSSGLNSMSEIASCSYAARKMGVRNGMLLGRALKLCPTLTTLPYDFEAYKSVSKTLYDIVSRFTIDIEAVSCDELYADCTSLLMKSMDSQVTKSDDNDGWCVRQNILNPLRLGSHLRALVASATDGCTASIGFGSSRLLARLATKRAKPDGQAWLFGRSANTGSARSEEEVQWNWYNENCHSSSNHDSLDPVTSWECDLSGDDSNWLCDLPIIELPGIGHHIVTRLSESFGVHTCGELMRNVTKLQLTELLGTKTGERIFWTCRGRDTSGIGFSQERSAKSVSACMNYGIRLKSSSELVDLVRSLSEELVSRMSRTHCDPQSSRGVLARCLTVRVFIRAPDAPKESAKFMGHGICSKSSRATPLPEPTADVNILTRTALALTRQQCSDPQELRGLGLQVHKLCPCKTMPQQVKSFFPMDSSPPALIDSIQDETSIPENTISFEKTPTALDTGNSQGSSSEPLSTPIRSRRRKSLRLRCRRNHSGDQSTSNLSVVSTVDNVVTSEAKLSDNSSTELASPSSFDSDIKKADAANLIATMHSSTPLPVKPTMSSARLPGQFRHTPLHVSGKTTAANNSILSDQTDYAFISNGPGLLTQVDSNPEAVFNDKSANDLQTIFGNWVATESEPQEEDLRILASYLVQLVPCDLERVRSCLILLSRTISHLTSSATEIDRSDKVQKLFTFSNPWRSALYRLRSTVDCAIQKCYGAGAKLRLHLCGVNTFK